jgi:hypothetical protein
MLNFILNQKANSRCEHLNLTNPAKMNFSPGCHWLGGQLQKFPDSLFPHPKLELGGCAGGWPIQEGSHGRWAQLFTLDPR